MAVIFTPQTTSNLTNQTSITQAIDSNFSSLASLLNDALSRSGAKPNAMASSLDMNSNQIINLPSPQTANSPVRLTDINSTLTPTPAILSGNNVYTGNNSFSGKNTFSDNTTIENAYFSPTDPWVDVLAFGADPTGSTDSSSAFSAAVAAVTGNSPSGGGIVYVPPGYYKLLSGVTLTSNITLQGAGRTATYLWSGNTDVTVVTMSGAGQNNLKDLAIFAKGSVFLAPDNTTFGASQPAVLLETAGSIIQNVSIEGGNNCLSATTNAIDNIIINTSFAFCYGSALYSCNGSNWHIRNKWDQGSNLATSSIANSYANWAANTSYTQGTSVITNGYVIVCSTAGTSGSSAPTLSNYGINITDGTAVWQLQQPANFYSTIIGDGAGENHFDMCDFSGDFNYGVSVQPSTTGSDPSRYSTFHACVITPGATVIHGDYCSFNQCNFAGELIITGGTVNIITDNTFGPNAGVSVSAGVSNFVISNNVVFSSGNIQVATGSSDYYVIVNNIVNGTVTDNGSGTHKTVSGNH